MPSALLPLKMELITFADTRALPVSSLYDLWGLLVLEVYLSAALKLGPFILLVAACIGLGKTTTSSTADVLSCCDKNT